MAIFSRVRSRLSEQQPTSDPHTWEFREQYSSSSSNKATIIPDPRELRNAFIPSATYNSPQEALAYPDTSHAAVHLSLLECFWKLRQNANQLDLQSYKPPIYAEVAETKTNRACKSEGPPKFVHWDTLIQLASTRFTTWWSNIGSVLSHASMYAIGGSRSEVQLSSNYLPPLDVLMVWYALMLDNGEYARVCHEASDPRLHTLCFPWVAIRDVIDRETMQYNLPRAAQNLFTTLSEQKADILLYLDGPPAYSETVASPFNIDLVAQVHLQQPFIDSSHNLLWIRSPAMRGSLRRASVDYLRSQSEGHLMNYSAENMPYAAELIWRTHRLYPARYAAYTRDVEFEPSPDYEIDLKITNSTETKISSTSSGISREASSNMDLCICWICERIKDDAPMWVYDNLTRSGNLESLKSLSIANVRQIQYDVGFYRATEKNRQAGLPLPTRPPTVVEKEAEKLEAKKKEAAGILPGIGEYLEVLPNGKTRIRIDKTSRATYGTGWMMAF